MHFFMTSKNIERKVKLDKNIEKFCKSQERYFWMKVSVTKVKFYIFWTTGKVGKWKSDFFFKVLLCNTHYISSVSLLMENSLVVILYCKYVICMFCSVMWWIYDKK